MMPRPGTVTFTAEETLIVFCSTVSTVEATVGSVDLGASRSSSLNEGAERRLTRSGSQALVKPAIARHCTVRFPISPPNEEVSRCMSAIIRMRHQQRTGPRPPPLLNLGQTTSHSSLDLGGLMREGGVGKANAMRPGVSAGLLFGAAAKHPFAVVPADRPAAQLQGINSPV
jgi:hypothetical protein